MSIETLKEIKPQFRSIRPFNLYKEWTFTDIDITHYSNFKDWQLAATSSNFLSNRPPNIFPTANVKYSRFYAEETGSIVGPNYTNIDDDGYVLSYQYTLYNGDKFNPYFHISSSFVNPDGSYQRIVHYSLYRLFYGPNAIHKDLFFGTSSTLHNEAFIFEFPKRTVADSIQPGYFVIQDSSDIDNLPYSISNSEGIKLIDDGRGNLFDTNNTGSVQRGNIFYKLGIAVITDVEYAKYFKKHLIDSRSVI